MPRLYCFYLISTKYETLFCKQERSFFSLSHSIYIPIQHDRKVWAFVVCAMAPGW